MNEHTQKAPSLTPPVKPVPAVGGVPGGQKKSAEPKAPKEPKVPRESNFKKVYPDTARITVLTEGGKNPKREGSKAHGTFSLYATNRTVGEFLKAGGFYAALSWDVGHGFIKVES